MNWLNVRFFLIFLIIFVLFFKLAEASIERTALVYANIKPVLSAGTSKQKYESQRDWINDQLSEELIENAWKTASLHYGVPPDVKRPEVLVSYDKKGRETAGRRICRKIAFSGSTSRLPKP